MIIFSCAHEKALTKQNLTWIQACGLTRKWGLPVGKTTDNCVGKITDSGERNFRRYDSDSMGVVEGHDMLHSAKTL